MTAKTPDGSFGASNIVFGYNAMGQRTNMSDQSGVTTYAYDSRDRLVEKVNPVGVIQYAYDPQGNLTNLETQVSGFTSQVSYTYDVLNRLHAVNDPRTGLTVYNYDNVGNLQNFILPNGVSQVYRYDILNRLTNVAVNSVTTPIESYRYTLGPSGHRLAVQEGNGRQVTYQYDNLYRLTRESILGASPLGDISYGFDPVGNRLAMTSTVFGIPSQVNTYDANDWLGSDTYDVAGNTKAATIHDSINGTDIAFTYSYDFDNRILCVTSVSSVVQLTYDGDGNRVQKTVTDAFGTRTTRYLVDQNNLTGYSQVLEELDASNNVTVAFTVGLDVISQTRFTPTNEVTHYFGYDGHGNTRFLTDTNETITDRWDYDAFGNIIARSGSTFNNLLYCGEYRDPDLGLYFLRARYMEPGRGRFWSADAFAGIPRDPRSLHKYVYAENSPVGLLDASGEFSLVDVMTGTSLNAYVTALFLVAVADLARQHVFWIFFHYTTEANALSIQSTGGAIAGYRGNWFTTDVYALREEAWRRLALGTKPDVGLVVKLYPYRDGLWPLFHFYHRVPWTVMPDGSIGGGGKEWHTRMPIPNTRILNRFDLW